MSGSAATGAGTWAAIPGSAAAGRCRHAVTAGRRATGAAMATAGAGAAAIGAAARHGWCRRRRPCIRRYRCAVTLLEVDQLRVTLQTARGPADALRGVSFTLDRGQTLGLIGESGSGKSITALALMGLLP